ncbi:AzlD domain-containing protein [Sutcliffiella halmapala]|uniref:AzlD domain-containing protein n=1 Tax=Sutcliffiella halmapala TaxID=79882 RepID=UPI000994CD5A|nr:AzlD domain-containing protein [Sutcliffiella halmapala]
MNNMIIIMIVGMAVVTYLPRLIPFVMFQGKELPPFIQSVLKNVPYAVLGALIVPGIFLINEDIMYGVIGVVVALVVAYLGANVILVVISAIAALSVYSWIVG